MKPRIDEIVVSPNLHTAQKLSFSQMTLRNPTVLPNPQLLWNATDYAARLRQSRPRQDSGAYTSYPLPM